MIWLMSGSLSHWLRRRLRLRRQRMRSCRSLLGMCELSSPRREGWQIANTVCFAGLQAQRLSS